MTTIERINSAAEALKSRLGGFEPEIGIVLGSGLGKLADRITSPISIPYSDIPGFPVSTAIGHDGLHSRHARRQESPRDEGQDPRL